jgi:hypothetical protein
MARDFPLALTLTLKQTITYKTPTGVVKRSLKRADCERIAKRFQQKLNRVVFGKTAAEKYGMTLKYLPVLEGERSDKRLHLHYAIGDLPAFVKFNQFDALVRLAKQQVPDIDQEHKVDIADSGWLEYVTKEIGPRDTDAVLWTLS